MTEQMLTQKLPAPFEAKDVEWRIQQTTQDKSRGLAVAFITSRAIQKRLDETVGPFHWKTEFSPWHQIVNKGSQLCALSIYDEERKEWVTKTDGAENSDIEPVKGGLSDSFKRAAVQWGIGRYLYSMGAVWVDVEQKGKNCTITEAGRRSLDARYAQMLQGKAPVPQKAVPQRTAPQGAAAPKPTVQRAAAPATLPPSKAGAFTFDYTVQDRKLSPDGKLTAISLCDRQGRQIVCLRPGDDRQLAQGICLRNVRLNPQRGRNNEVVNLLESYEIAA